MKLRSFFYGLLAIVIVLLLVGAGGFYWIAAQSPLSLLKGGQDKAPAAAMFVPRQAPVMVSLLVKPDQLAAFRQVVAPPQQRQQARAEVAQLKQSLLANMGLDYERDIQPWVGNEMTLAITTLDIDRDSSNGKQPGYLLAIATQDPEQSREFLQLFWQKQAIAGTDLTFEQYKGVKLIYAETSPLLASSQKGQKGQKAKGKAFETSPDPRQPSSYRASAVVGNQFVLFANDPKVLRDAITNVQAPDLNLNNAGFYGNALTALNQPRIGLAFVNLPGLANWLEGDAVVSKKSGKSAVDSGKETLAKTTAGKYQTLAIALELNRQGLLANTALQTADGNDATVIPVGTKPVEALQYLPSSSAISASGTNLDRLWKELSGTLSSYETVDQLVDQPLQTFQTRWHLDLPKDVFSWVNGDYALGVLPNQVAIADTETATKGKGRKSSPPKANPSLEASKDWIFVAERSGAEATTAIAHLDDLAKQQGYSIGTLPLGDQTVSAWTRLKTGAQTSKTLQAEVQGVHASVGNYEIFATSVAGIEAALQATQNSLAKNNSFQQAIAPLQQPNNGYLYLDWNASRSLLERQFPVLKVVQLAGKPFFSHLRSLTLSSYGSQDGVQRSGIFIQLKNG